MAVFTLDNNTLQIAINSFGAELISLKHQKTELIWQADKNIWPRYAPVLFPIVGKLKNDAYTVDSTEYKLGQHGFARDKEFTLISQTESVLEFELTASEDTMKLFPFHFSFIIRYALEKNRLTISYKIFNPDNTTLFFSVGAHPGFNCGRVQGESINDFYLDFGEKEELIAQKLENGLISDTTYSLPLRNGVLELSTRLFDSDAVVLKNNQVSSVTLASSKTEAKIKMECSNWPYFGIWTKKGSDAFVCLEPWYGIADSVNAAGALKEKEGILSLDPQDTFDCSFSLEVN
jgi:galactose mutarotase-like enzyme